MRKLVLLTLYVLAHSFCAANAQPNADNQEAEGEEVLKYDSLNNIGRTKNFKMLVGQQIQYVNKENHSQYECPFSYDGMMILFDSIFFKHTFLITDVGYIDGNEAGMYLKAENDETFFYRIDEPKNVNKDFVVLGFYEKLKERFVGKNLLFFNANYIDPKHGEIFNFETGEPIKGNIEKYSVWTCTDVTLKFSNEINYHDFYDRNPIIFIIENKDFGKCYCFYEDQFGDKYVGTHNRWEKKQDLVLGKFIFEEDYLAEKQQLEAMRLETERKAAERRAAKQAAEKKREERANTLKDKYGEENAKLMMQGKAKIGWTPEMCKEALGEPKQTEKTANAEQWIYAEKRLIFKNGKLKTIQ